MKSRLAVDAIAMAVARRGNVTGCIVHSDRGSQFRSRKFLAALRTHGLVGSMGQVASAGDNAAMESFFALLQKNHLPGRFACDRYAAARRRTSFSCSNNRFRRFSSRSSTDSTTAPEAGR